LQALRKAKFLKNKAKKKKIIDEILRNCCIFQKKLYKNALLKIGQKEDS